MFERCSWNYKSGYKITSFDDEPDSLTQKLVYNNRDKKKPLDISQYIDHTILKQDTSEDKVRTVLE